MSWNNHLNPTWILDTQRWSWNGVEFWMDFHPTFVEVQQQQKLVHSNLKCLKTYKILFPVWVCTNKVIATFSWILGEFCPYFWQGSAAIREPTAAMDWPGWPNVPPCPGDSFRLLKWSKTASGDRQSWALHLVPKVAHHKVVILCYFSGLYCFHFPMTKTWHLSFKFQILIL